VEDEYTNKEQVQLIKIVKNVLDVQYNHINNQFEHQWSKFTNGKTEIVRLEQKTKQTNKKYQDPKK
jgi:predicted patatin/cPLA2 family phospholipase